MLVGFGRCNIPHLGHKHLIDKCDVFVLSNGKQNMSVESRMKMLGRLGVDISKIVVDNPYRYLAQNTSNKDVIVYTEENTSLVEKFKDRNSMRINRLLGISSSRIKRMVEEGKKEEIVKLYKDRDVAVDVIRFIEGGGRL